MKIKNNRLRILIAIALMIFIIICAIAIPNALRPIPGSGLETGNVSILPISAVGSSFAITSDENLWRWGFTDRLEDGTVAVRNKPQKVMTNASAIFEQGSTIMMICSNGTLWTQGREIRGARHWFVRFLWMMTPLRAPRNDEPTAIMENVVSFDMTVSHDFSFAMAITSDGTLWGWGENRSGQLGLCTTNNHYRRPVRVMNDVVAVATGSFRTFAITSEGTLWGWGGNRFGCLGDGTTENSRNPIRLMEDVVAVSTHSSNVFAITSDGKLWAWGGNWGQLGDGTIDRRHSPVHILDSVVAVSSGSSHNMAITSDGTLWGWGNNEFGQLGDGTTENRLTPTRIMEDVVVVSAGHSHTLAVTSDGVLWAWGNNQHGQLGDGTTENRHSPVRIMDGILLPPK